MNSCLEGVRLLCAVRDFMNDAVIEKILENKKTVLKIIMAEKIQQDVLSSLREKVETFSRTIEEINFKGFTQNTDVQKNLTAKLEIIKFLNNGFLTRCETLSLVDKILQKAEGLKQERKELKIPETPVLDETFSEKEVAPVSSPKVTPMPQAETPVKPKELAEEETGALPPSAKEAEVKQRRVSSKVKEKKAKGVQPLGYQEKLPTEIEKARKEKSIDMVQGLRQRWKSLKFKDIQQAVKQLGGTIKINGKNSHYTIRLKHIETDHPILGATLNKKAAGEEYPWWLDTAVDALERAVGLITEDMSRIYEKVHEKVHKGQ